MVRIIGKVISKNDVSLHENSIAGKIIRVLERRNVNTAIMSLQEIFSELNANEKEKRSIRSIIRNKQYSRIFQPVDRAHYKIQRYRYEYRRVKVAV